VDRSVRIFALGVIGLCAAFLIQGVQSYVLAAMALCPPVLLVVGQFYLPRSKRTIHVWFNPIVIEYEGELISPEQGMPLGRLSGKDLFYGSFRQWHEFEIVTHRFILLSGIGLISLGAVWLTWKIKDSLFGGIGYFYAMGFFWLLIVLLAMQWVWNVVCFALKASVWVAFPYRETQGPHTVRFFIILLIQKASVGADVSIQCTVTKLMI
jgi:hypothetical protein